MGEDLRWELIETAPKSGIIILLWGSSVLYGVTIRVEEEDRSCILGSWDGEAWADETEGWILEPTHWVQLSKPQ